MIDFNTQYPQQVIQNREVIQLGEEDWYDRPAWYDILHQAGTAEEVRGIEAICGVFAGKSEGLRVLEPACGTGRFLRILASRGHEVAGFDANEGMVAYCQNALERRSLAGAVWVDRMESFGLPRGMGRVKFDVCVNLINTIRHLEDEAGVVEHLRRVRGVLRKCGVSVVGLSVMGLGIEHPSEDVWIGTRGRCRVVQAVQYLPAEDVGSRGGQGARFETVLSHLTVTTAGHEMHLDTTYRLRAWTGREWLEMVRRAGLEAVRVVDEWGVDLAGRNGRGPLCVPDSWDSEEANGYAIWILRRRG